jgi:hypothetical protein
MINLVVRLRALLSTERANHLSVILAVLTSPTSKVYTAFWSEFNEHYGRGSVVKSPEATMAWNALRELNGIVADYLEASE